jgi:NAD(P)H-hydrate repair Nnr-like enzyme with NAD(P)H-hydrate dehydratase domain
VEKAQKPLLLDADGLKAFAKLSDSLRAFGFDAACRRICYSHWRELPQTLEEKVVAIRKRAKKNSEPLLLVKGKVDIICDSERSNSTLPATPA